MLGEWKHVACRVFFLLGMSLIVLQAFITGVFPKHNMALFLSSHPWMAAFQPVFSSFLLLRFVLSLSASCPLSPCPSIVTCVMSCVMFCETLHCSRLNYNLDVADRLADEHALIRLYVNLLQNNPRSWLVWCAPVFAKHQWKPCALLISQSFP